MKKFTKKVVCLGGGIGTVNLIKGLKQYGEDISVIVSMADEGGSSGRLRRLYNVFPMGDLVSCMAGLSKDPSISKLLTYRFPGNRYGSDTELAGHKLGNLIMVAMNFMTEDFTRAIELFQHIFHISGNVLPATSQQVSISAKTTDGKIIEGEEKIDLGKYNGKRVLDHIYLHPNNVSTSQNVLSQITDADVIIAGPGDLYTTILPVLIVPSICEALKNSKAQKIFVVNVANKPFETRGYAVSDYMYAVKKHISTFPFDTVIMNNNYSVSIPKKYHYTYVKLDQPQKRTADNIKIIEKDLVDEKFPIYHDSTKLANIICELI